MFEFKSTINYERDQRPRAGSGVVTSKNWPAPFPGRMSYKATEPGLVLFYILASVIVLLFIRAPFHVLLVFASMCSVFWLFWLSYQYLPSDWLERLLWRSLMCRGDRLQKARAEECILWFSWFIVLVHCFIMYCVVSCPYVIYFNTFMARYSLCLC